MRNAIFFLAASLSTAILLGCSGPPFPLAPVSGTVTWEDGTPLSGDQNIVEFYSQVEPDGAIHPPMASGVINSSDGSFQLRSRTGDDGAVIGTNKVSVQYYKKYPDSPIELIPVGQAEVEVQSGSNSFTFKVKKP